MMFSQRDSGRSFQAWSLALLAAVGVVGSVGCAAVQPGCGCAIGCAVEPGCGCEPGCAVEPACGCAAPCGTSGCSMAGQKWCGDCGCAPCKPLINVCTGPCSCAGCCEPSCGCEPGCAVEPGCGCAPSCGVAGCGSSCSSGCGCGQCPVAQGVGFGLRSIGAELRRLASPLGICCPSGGCGGCGELYWNEWHSDPPACCDPCDNCGTWVGPSSAGVTTPHQSFEPRRVAKRPEAGKWVR